MKEEIFLEKITVKASRIKIYEDQNRKQIDWLCRRKVLLSLGSVVVFILVYFAFSSSFYSSSFYSILKQNSAEADDNNYYDGRITIEALDEFSSTKRRPFAAKIILINANKCWIWLFNLTMFRFIFLTWCRCRWRYMYINCSKKDIKTVECWTLIPKPDSIAFFMFFYSKIILFTLILTILHSLFFNASQWIGGKSTQITHVN